MLKKGQGFCSLKFFRKHIFQTGKTFIPGRGRWVDGFHWGLVWFEQSDQAVKAFWGGGKVALVKGSEKELSKGGWCVPNIIRYNRVEIRGNYNATFSFFSHRVTTNWRRLKDVVHPVLQKVSLRASFLISVNVLKEGEWPVYPEVVSAKDNLWESLVGEEHVDGRRVRYLITFLWLFCQLVSWFDGNLDSVGCLIR